MKNDIINRDDIELLINSFYKKVQKDPLIAFFFTKIVPVNWEAHLPVMYGFWENILFFSGTYEGNPMAKHKSIHQKCPMKMEHFQRWTSLFNETVDELFEGDKAELAKQRAMSIATVMQIKMFS
ncbi:group III truncated hemoglobin [Sediminibacterium sp.]|uniref:group III truncated hemoglobin n=1 Tax=Sediminibacterium sp. TaxID=1917865 RepID=UPI003F71E691